MNGERITTSKEKQQRVRDLLEQSEVMLTLAGDVHDGVVDLIEKVSDNRDAYAIKRAITAGIDTAFVNPKIYDSKKDFDTELVKYLKERNIELICLAGYMRRLTPYFIKEYASKIINIHPALLPSFKGLNGVKDALDYGVKITGPTVHFVTEEVDGGPIISQSAVEVKDDDDEELAFVGLQALQDSLWPTK